MPSHYPVVIAGGGTAGLTVAAQLVNAIDPSRIALIEPSTHHFYQPLWTLVGGGVFPKEESMRQEADYYSVKHESLDTNVSVSCGHWRW